MSALGSAPLIQPQDLYASSTTQQITLGSYAETTDGRGFRYVLGTGTAMVAGRVYQSSPQGGAAGNGQAVGIAATWGTGTFFVTTGSNVTLIANELTGGFLSVRQGTGGGFMYRIKSHPAITAGTVIITLEDPLVQALTASSSIIDLTPSPYSNVVIWATAGTATVVGVAIQNTPANQFGWLQTHGVANVLIDASAPTTGASITPSLATAGAVALAGGTAAIIGFTTMRTTSAAVQPVFLTID